MSAHSQPGENVEEASGVMAIGAASWVQLTVLMSRPEGLHSRLSRSLREKDLGLALGVGLQLERVVLAKYNSGTHLQTQHLGGRDGGDLCESESSQICRVSSKTARDTQENLVSKKKKNPNPK